MRDIKLISSGRLIDDLLYCIDLQTGGEKTIKHHYRRWPVLTLYLSNALVTRTYKGVKYVYEFKQGELGLYPHAQAEECNWAGSTTALHLNFSPVLLANGSISVQRTPIFTDMYLCEALSDLAFMQQNRLLQDKLIVTKTIQEIVDHISRYYSSCHQLMSPKIGTMPLDDLLNQMHDHNAAINTVTTLSKMTNVSERHFRNLFHRYVGKSPLQYLTNSRIATAKYLLKVTDLSLAEIALRTGHYDQSHFSKVLKQKTGLNPGMFRRA